MSSPPTYEPEIMERFAAVLDRRARSLIRGLTIAGAIVGGAVGALPLTPAGHIWPVPHLFGFTTVALGVAAGAVLGYAVARNRAGMVRLHAQSTLCQLHAQRTTFALWMLLKERTPDVFAATETAAAPEPVALPVAPEPEPFVLPAVSEPIALPAAPEPVAVPVMAEPIFEPEPAFEPLPVLEPEAAPAFEPPVTPSPARPLPHVLVTAPPPTTFVPVHAATPAPAPPPLSPPYLFE